MEFVRLNEDEYKNFADHSPYRNIWQSVPMSNLRKANGWQVYFVGLKEQEEIQCACTLVAYPIGFGRSIFQVLRGYVIDYKNTDLLHFFHTHLISFIKEHKGVHVSIDPYVIYRKRDKFGAMVENEEANDDVVLALKQLGYQHRGFSVGVDEANEEPRWMFVLPIQDKTEAILWKDLNQLTRRNIKKTQRDGFSLMELDREHLYLYKELMTHTAMRCGFQDRPLSYYEKMYDVFHKDGYLKYVLIVLHPAEYKAGLCKDLEVEKKKLAQIEDTIAKNPENAKSLRKKKAICDVIESIEKKMEEAATLHAEKGDEIVVSGAMFLLYGDEVMYLTGGSYEQMMHYSAQYRLQWEMILYALHHGYKDYNFYGIDGIFDKGSEGYGVLEFKQGYSGEVRELIGVFDYTIAPMLYHCYRTLRKWKHSRNVLYKCKRRTH